MAPGGLTGHNPTPSEGVTAISAFNPQPPHLQCSSVTSPLIHDSVRELLFYGAFGCGCRSAQVGGNEMSPCNAGLLQCCSMELTVNMLSLPALPCCTRHEYCYASIR